MSGNSFGSFFRVTHLASHGPALGCVIDGCPPGLPLSEADLQFDLDRRKPGTSKYATQRRKAILSRYCLASLKASPRARPSAFDRK